MNSVSIFMKDILNKEVIMKKGKRLAAMGLLSVMALSTYGSAFQVKEENFQDLAPYINPTVSNGKNVLFDNTHGQTAGAADWVIDGGFSDYAQGLASAGYYVQELRKQEAITYDDLKEYDMFVIPEANIPFKASEQDAIGRYVSDGGSVFFIADHYNADRNKNRWDASEVFNGYRRGAFADPAAGMSAEEAASPAMAGVESSDWLAETFGVRFRYNAVGDVNASQIVAAADSFGITDGVDAVAMHAGSTIAILDPDVAKGIVYLPDGLTQSDKWSSSVDQGVYDGGGKAEGAYVAIAKKGEGKAAFIGDSSAVEDASPKYKKEENGQSKRTYDGYREQDDATLLLQLSDWLATQEDYADFTEAGITLDEVTALKDFEDPASSTEPQAEPWAQPESGYKWYDASTFAAGSYGYEGGTVTPPVEEQGYSLYVPDQMVSGIELPLTVRISGAEPNSTISGLKVGAYLDGGIQIGQFKDIDGTWPEAFGYSTPFSVETDAEGNAVKSMIFRIKEGTEGAFNLRIKQGSSNVLTQTCEASIESEEGLPEVGTPVYSIIKPDVIKNGTVMALTVRVRNLIPGQAVSGLRIGSYLSGGTQIGKFSVDGKVWPAQNGYSENLTLTADDKGIISQTFLFEMDGTVTGDANIRLKSGSSNVFAETISIID